MSSICLCFQRSYRSPSLLINPWLSLCSKGLKRSLLSYLYAQFWACSAMRLWMVGTGCSSQEASPAAPLAPKSLVNGLLPKGRGLLKVVLRLVSLIRSSSTVKVNEVILLRFIKTSLSKPIIIIIPSYLYPSPYISLFPQNIPPFVMVITCLSYYYNLSMPPKKDGKKQALSKPDNSGIAKQDVEFRCVLTVKADGAEAPNYAVMFEWFGNLSDKMERYESPLIEGWKKQQNTYTFEKEFDLIRVDDDFCKTISTKQFYLYFVNPDDNKVEDQLFFDYSSLLTPNEGQPKFVFESNTVKAFGVESFSLVLTADKPLLGEVFRHYLNPLEVEVIGAKDLPVEKSSKYEPAYIQYRFFNGETAQTHPLVGSDKLLWSHKHVFLLGLMNPTQLKEKMRSNYLKFQLHDRDELNNKKIKADVEVFDIGKAIQQEMEKEKPVEEDPKKKGQAKKEDKKEVKKQAKKQAKKKDAKLGQPILPPKKEILTNNYGVSACSLVEFLKPSMKTARYKIPVVPRNTFEDFQSRNIDLNTTARNEMQKVIASSNYFDCDTVLVVGFTLAHPIGTFVKPQKQEQPVVQDPKKKKDPKEVPPPPPAAKQQEKEPSKDVFQRVIYVIPYRDAATVKLIEDTFYAANQKALNLKSRREITTHLLTPEQQASRTLDFISGFELVDPQGRIYILEGLRSGAVKEFHAKMVRKAPNSKDFKIFKNSSISFTSRLFAGFHLELKRIRLRPSLAQLLLEPSIYIKSKVPEEISQSLNRLADLRKICDDLATADAMSLWPSAQWLIQIERKFSQSLSQEDLSGEEVKSTKKQGAADGDANRTIRLLENTDLKVVTADEFFLPKIPQATDTNAFQQSGMNQTAQRRTVMTKTFTKDAAKSVASYQMRGKPADLGDQPVYIYAGQTNNFYQKKLRELREEMRKNPNLIYTYNKDYFRLAIDPHVPDEEAKKERELSLSKMYSKDKFSSLLVRTKDQRLRLPNRLPEDDADDIRKYPYHEEKAREKEMRRNVRDQPPTNGSQDFKKYIRRQDLFSQYAPVEGERLSPVEQEKIEREQRKKLQEEEQKKLKGDAVIHTKKGYFADKAYGVDRFKDIREGEAQKLGLIDINKREKAKRPVQNLEVSYNLKETPVDPAFNPLVRRDDPSLNIQKDQFNFYQGKEVLMRTQVYKPLKDTL